DITKLNCVSSFSASKYPINEFFPISLFDLQTKGLGLSYASIEEKAEKLLEATNFWQSEQRETRVYLPTEDAAMWFLVSTPSDFDCCENHVSTSSHQDVHTARSWRLALLVKNSIVFGSPLDPSKGK
ncbi:F/Y rich carboxy-terminal protein, partial [Trifolium medium]|nr:F/Y rich carboxy-terminal protein [Trifolium medium]